jgi:hypothetical protein
LTWSPFGIAATAYILIVMGRNPIIVTAAMISAFVVANLLLALSTRSAPNADTRSEMWRREACFLNAQCFSGVVTYAMIYYIVSRPFDQGISIGRLVLVILVAVGLSTLANLLLTKLFRQPFSFWRGPQIG